MRKYSVFIADKDLKSIVNLKNQISCFKSLKFLDYANDGDECFQKLINYKKVDFLILDLILPKIDGYLLLEKIKNNKIISIKNIICTSYFSNEEFMKYMKDLNVKFFFIKPYDYNQILKLMEILTSNKSLKIIEKIQSKEQINIEKNVDILLSKLKVPLNLVGHRYLKSSILEVLQNEEMLFRITKLLYPTIASKHKTTSYRVERSIRSAIKITWQRNNCVNIHELFGIIPSFKKEIPSNSELISLISEKIKMDFKNLI
ncbi:MAG: sporulation initiation factor Spo0A C-terminal domain-containing protein [Bacilli bacterium]|nr:sporulation initiation factor Spo0A C-terminal domain-containing protein [Bacilli bacterium]